MTMANRDSQGLAPSLYVGGANTAPPELPQVRTFMRSVLRDLRALEQMLDGPLIESGLRRIGAEQELFLVDAQGRPASIGPDLLEELGHPALTTELGRFNLEANLNPQIFGGRCLRSMESELNSVLATVQEAAQRRQSHVVLTGILPTLRRSHLGIDNMTPLPRYHTLNNVMTKLCGGTFRIRIKGTDEIHIAHDNVMLEACNTSFQIHFQAGSSEFPRLYNAAQVVTSPVLAAAVNSPVWLGHRLWKETRIALFQQSVDARSTTHQTRGQSTRVSFGESWVRDSVLDIFREDVTRHRVVLARVFDEEPAELLAAGRPPELSSLRLHNGTVYRWNRACYGVNDGIAHLRIENRALPAGPTVVDEVANAAFYYGLLSAITQEHDDVAQTMPFDHARSNFYHAASHGLEARLHWTNGGIYTARDLILNELLPAAHEGLRVAGIHDEDRERYLGIIEERVRSGMTGAQWALNSLEGMSDQGTADERSRTLVTATVERQKTGDPVHKWTLATLKESPGWRASYDTVEQFMTSDVLTVQPDDVIELAASLMAWNHIRFLPVEDDDGALVGLVSHRELVGLLGGQRHSEAVAIRDVMCCDPPTVTPETSAVDAMALMRAEGAGCLPVVQGTQLLGIISESDLFNVASLLLQEPPRRRPRSRLVKAVPRIIGAGTGHR